MEEGEEETHPLVGFQGQTETIEVRRESGPTLPLEFFLLGQSQNLRQALLVYNVTTKRVRTHELYIHERVTVSPARTPHTGSGILHVSDF